MKTTIPLPQYLCFVKVETKQRQFPQQAARGGDSSGEDRAPSSEDGDSSGQGGERSGEDGDPSGEDGDQSGEGEKCSGEDGDPNGEGSTPSGEGREPSGEGGVLSDEGELRNLSILFDCVNIPFSTALYTIC